MATAKWLVIVYSLVSWFALLLETLFCFLKTEITAIIIPF